MPDFRRAILPYAALAIATCCAGASCERSKAASSPPASKEAAKIPTLRVYALSTVAGAIEPCGCVKDMLGGIDHAAAFMQAQASAAPAALAVSAGPVFFMDPEIDPARRDQHVFKANAIAESLRDMGLTAFASGTNDWAAGPKVLEELTKNAGAPLLAANLADAGAFVQPTKVLTVSGVKVGLVGISEPAAGRSDASPSVVVDSLGRAKKSLDEQGVNVRIALLSLPRGEALRAVEQVPGFQLAVVGKPKDAGEGNDAPPPPALVNRTLVVQAPNHLTAFGVVDLFVRDGSYDFSDGSGIAALENKASLDERVRELRARIAEWERRGNAVSPKDLEARKKDLARLEAEQKGASTPAPPAKGSYFQYKLVEVREALGSAKSVSARIAKYYERVNDHNRELFKDRVPPPAAANQSSYIGIEKCSMCHGEERDFWNKTAHSGAYETLSTAHKEFNLDCVGCHVTGYEKPGGSTVTHVADLKSVQCEVCHGPGSRHVTAPSNPEFIVAKPAKTLCAPQCHHPPHVKPDWNVDAAWKRIIGPGHGT